MSTPRRLVPGRTHATTRRTTGRRFLLKPTPEVTAILGYTLGLAQERTGIPIYGLMAEADHVHQFVRDTPDRSRLSDFKRDFHSLSARALNAHWGRGESLWKAPGSFGNVEVQRGDRVTLEEQLLYLWTNPVRDGLVERPEQWPGLMFLPEDFGTTRTFERPKTAFFGGRRPEGWIPTDPDARREHLARRRERRRDELLGRIPPSAPPASRGKRRRGKRKRKERAPRPERQSPLPDRVTLRCDRPPFYDEMTLEEVRAYFRARLEERLAEIHAARRAQGLLDYIGVPRVMAQDPNDSAGDTFPDFALDPRLACRNDPERFTELRRELKQWRLRYRAARLAYRAGDRPGHFPWGTYLMLHEHGVLVDTSSPIEPG